MHSLINRWFIKSIIALLAITSIAKMISIFEGLPYLLEPDPFLKILNNKQILLLAGLMEISVIFALVRMKSILSSQKLILWLSSLFLFYHFSLWFIDAEPTCGCLGNALQWLRLPEAYKAKIPVALAAYMFTGSLLSILIAAFNSTSFVHLNCRGRHLN